MTGAAARAEPLRLEVGPPAPDGLVSARLNRPPPGEPPGVPVLLTHGAGGDLAGAGLSALAAGLAGLGHPVVRFNMGYREAGRASPPKAERSVPGYAAAYAAARSALAGGPGADLAWAVGGKSYGGRVASLAVAAGMPAGALVFYGYPLHAPGHEDSPRTEHWPDITVPSLFLEGTEDPFCNLELLRAHLPRLGGPATLHVVDGGDHSLRVKAGRTPDGKPAAEGVVLARLAPVVAAWLESVLA